MSNQISGRELLIEALSKFVVDTQAHFDEQQRKFAAAVILNPRQALETIGRDIIGDQANLEIANAVQVRLESDAVDPLREIDRLMDDYQDRLLRGFYRGSSTCPMHNVVQAQTALAIGDIVRWYQQRVAVSNNVDAANAAKEQAIANASAPLGVDAEGNVITMADYEQVKRNLRRAQLELTPIGDLIKVLKATQGLTYRGQPKADMVEEILERELPARAMVAADPEITAELQAQAPVTEPEPAPEPEIERVPSSPAEARQWELEAMTMDELKPIAAELKVIGRSSLKKDALIDAILDAEGH